MNTNITDAPSLPRERAPALPSRRRSASKKAAALAGVDSATTAPLPDGLAFTERATSALRAALRRRGLRDYLVFYNYFADFDLDDLEEHLAALGEAPGTTWEPLPPLARGTRRRRHGRACPPGVANVRLERDRVRGLVPGFIHLRRHDVVVARWFWLNPVDDTLVAAWLCAAPTFEHYGRLRDELRRLRRERTAADWRQVTGDSVGERIPRTQTGGEAEGLMISDALRQRVDAEIVRFFSTEAAALYKSMRVPHRRGVLLYGPPGNGKTSLIRLIGSLLPGVPGIILRPGAKFDTDHLAGVVRRWTGQAPCILVIEDLDWMLKQVDVSAFLNLIDGVDSASTTGGLLLLATTNHPERLDPAVNNRPGRFDVVIEIPAPDEPTRLTYLRRHLADIGDAVLSRVAADADGLAFAHLQEIVRLSGLLAINAGRSARADDDVRSAASTVREAYDAAVRGYPSKPAVEFGLGYLRRTARCETPSAD